MLVGAHARMTYRFNHSAAESPMALPASSSPPQVARAGLQRAPSPGKTWFRTREGRRYGWEIALIIVVKLMLLIMLWFLFIKPWPRPATPPAAVVHQFYAPAATAVPHD